MKTGTGALLFLASGAAIACTVIGGSSFSINIGAVSPSSMAEDIGGRLQTAFGDRWGRDTHIEGYVQYRADLPWPFGEGGLNTMPFVKPCGKTFEEQAKVLWPDNTGVGGGGGEICGVSGGGSLGLGVVGYSPVYGTATTCTPTSCNSTSYIKGYEPIYGMTEYESEIGDNC